VIEIPRESIAFLQEDGNIKAVNFSTSSVTSSGVLALGKFQFVRQRLLQLDEIHIENVVQGTPFSFYILSTLDGKNGTRSNPIQLESTNLYRRYGSRAIGVNHSLILKGGFCLVSLELQFNIHGKR
jgi:hypothetical protein